MKIAYVEISNFRKLLSVRIDLSEKTTLLVGANNSGKTSAMLALRYFLVTSGQGMFCMNDFTLSNWSTINAIGKKWESATGESEPVGSQLADWAATVPTLDLWLDVEDGEIHHVSKLIPTLDWNGGRLGVRLRFEPKDVSSLRKEFLAAVENVNALKTKTLPSSSGPGSTVTLWPEDMTSFLERELQKQFTVRAYTLDPAKATKPADGQAQPQVIPLNQEPIDNDNLKALIRIDEINAQRVFGSDADTGDSQDPRSGRQLSVQLRNYYEKHLDPTKSPDASDFTALEAIEDAKKIFNERLKTSFAPALNEVQGIGYPGVSNPRISISTQLKPVESLNHATAVQYEVDAVSKNGPKPILKLPEDFNGLGYQNLISMIFRLMGFRDAWMRVGKAGKGAMLDPAPPPLHLVLVEEPEAHLHAQVQQVFINKAYDVLRNHLDLNNNPRLNTQLVVSTHSSHIAHEAEFSCLRYFRRLPAGLKADIPISTVVNLSGVFGTDNETKRFVTRYLKAQHCDLFFADAAILVEGPAERMLVPLFIRKNYPFLTQLYITMLEIGGSHAHRLKPLIDELQLLTVVITDLDAGDPTSKNAAVPPEREKGQVSNNSTLKTWVPKCTKIDELLRLTDDKKICSDNGGLFAVRAAYQIPLTVKSLAEGGVECEVLPNTFEDALVFENLRFFSTLNGTGLVQKFRNAIEDNADLRMLGTVMFEELKTGKKAEFALDVIDADNFDSLTVPAYIAQGLDWLKDRLLKDATEIAVSPGENN